MFPARMNTQNTPGNKSLLPTSFNWYIQILSIFFYCVQEPAHSNNEASDLGTILVANSDDAHEGDITMEGDGNSTGNPKLKILTQVKIRQWISKWTLLKKIPKFLSHRYIATKGPEPRTESTVNKNKHLIGYAMVNLALPRCGGKGPSLITGPVQRDISKKILDSLIEATMTMLCQSSPGSCGTVKAVQPERITIEVPEAPDEVPGVGMVAVTQGGTRKGYTVLGSMMGLQQSFRQCSLHAIWVSLRSVKKKEVPESQTEPID
ncbi:hypothetical protein F5890DRAFT_1477829 [Lentinula detonsa]|uniref:Uncharacterized protein n=1 Tax=Lentinula detonsa TaxID=2804962 RepID=A0AA38PRD1_9AGAR|nr:hypothetical protein F5890DRAFT_1477829 [Lentinula detonsa]